MSIFSYILDHKRFNNLSQEDKIKIFNKILSILKKNKTYRMTLEEYSKFFDNLIIMNMKKELGISSNIMTFNRAYKGYELNYRKFGKMSKEARKNPVINDYKNLKISTDHVFNFYNFFILDPIAGKYFEKFIQFSIAYEKKEEKDKVFFNNIKKEEFYHKLFNQDFRNKLQEYRNIKSTLELKYLSPKNRTTFLKNTSNLYRIHKEDIKVTSPSELKDININDIMTLTLDF